MHVIIVSAQVLLVLTLGLWTLGLTILARASGAGRPGWRSLTRLTLTLRWTFTRRLTDGGEVEIRDLGNYQDWNNYWPHLRHQDEIASWDLVSGVRVADVRDLDILNKMDDIKIRVSYMKTIRVRRDSCQSLIYVEMLWSINYQFVFHGTKNKMIFQEQVVTIITFL